MLPCIGGAPRLYRIFSFVREIPTNLCVTHLHRYCQCATWWMQQFVCSPQSLPLFLHIIHTTELLPTIKSQCRSTCFPQTTNSYSYHVFVASLFRIHQFTTTAYVFPWRTPTHPKIHAGICVLDGINHFKDLNVKKNTFNLSNTHTLTLVSHQLASHNNLIQGTFSSLAMCGRYFHRMPMQFFLQERGDKKHNTNLKANASRKPKPPPVILPRVFDTVIGKSHTTLMKYTFQFKRNERWKKKRQEMKNIFLPRLL